MVFSETRQEHNPLLQLKFVITDSVITNSFWSQIGHFSTQNNPVITNTELPNLTVLVPFFSLFQQFFWLSFFSFCFAFWWLISTRCLTSWLQNVFDLKIGFLRSIRTGVPNRGVVAFFGVLRFPKKTQIDTFLLVQCYQCTSTTQGYREQKKVGKHWVRILNYGQAFFTYWTYKHSLNFPQQGGEIGEPFTREYWHGKVQHTIEYLFFLFLISHW